MDVEDALTFRAFFFARGMPSPGLHRGWGARRNCAGLFVVLKDERIVGIEATADHDSPDRFGQGVEHMEVAMRVPVVVPWFVSLVMTSSVMAADQPTARPTLTDLIERAASPWLPTYNPKNMALADAESQITCEHSHALPIPQADLPVLADLPAMQSCDLPDAFSSYYGYQSVNMVRARHCGYLRRADGAFGGSEVLAMIYANGAGVPRNLPLATKFACEAGGAPREIELRVAHLALMAASASPAPFDFCDDITSGYMSGICAMIKANLSANQRQRKFDAITRNFNSAQLMAYVALRNASREFFQARSGNEVHLNGSAWVALAIADQQEHEDLLLDGLTFVEAGKIPPADATMAGQADSRLKEIVRRVLANPEWPQQGGTHFPYGDSITVEGIRADQQLWHSYRDTWLRFAAERKPALSRDAVAVWLSTQRANELRSFLPEGDPDRVDGDR